MDENELLDIILDNVELLTCFNCGEKLIDKMTLNNFDLLGVIHLDKGSNNYPNEPDEEAGIYFECMKCRNVEYP